MMPLYQIIVSLIYYQYLSSHFLLMLLVTVSAVGGRGEGDVGRMDEVAVEEGMGGGDIGRGDATMAIMAG
ncbi:hypothetical protein L1987_55864 [Smallanthus sonchifolius]|uniref:Uncharacterized protein n=1 Tax=Smallanthus sonchifolius TaxID=185202 RepID=A0ACB9EBF9_9ASTR|nr:hypothetical protein L1987_55864 [Smallanthus sonchifolius]